MSESTTSIFGVAVRDINRLRTVCAIVATAPRPFKALSCKTVLVMEFFEGRPLRTGPSSGGGTSSAWASPCASHP